MKLKSVLISVVIAGTAFLGASGTAVAAPAVAAPSGTASSVATPGYWQPIPGTYSSWAKCKAAGSSSAQQPTMCEQLPTGRWKLYVWVD